LQQMAMSSYSRDLLRDCGLPEDSLVAKLDDEGEDLWNWSEMSDLSKTLLQALDAATEHALMVCISNSFIYVDIAKLKFL
jgi:hypothetical protein